jgi:methylated-DNA-[protein]-cysteine S-methyltransferase
MDTQHYALFETAIGSCGIVWSARGVAGVQLPEASTEATRERIVGTFPAVEEAAPPAHIQQAIDGITALLRGEPIDLTSIVLDMQGVPPFHQRVYDVTRRVPPGSTRSYGEIAADLGDPGAARAVGQALGRNPFVIVVPCHRVLAAGGRPGGFSASGGLATKMRLLDIEGAEAEGTLPLFKDQRPKTRDQRRPN